MSARRHVLFGLMAAILALLPGRPRLSLSASAAGLSPPLGHRLAAVLPHAESWAHLGRKIIRSGVALELDARRLEDKLVEACDSAAGLGGVADDVLRGAIAKIIEADFAAERMVAVGGWRLAEAEAAICKVIAADAGSFRDPVALS